MDSEKRSPQARLDRLYTQVLEAAYPIIAPPLSQRLRIVLGSIVSLKDPLAIGDLEKLLGGLEMANIDIRLTLLRLHSIVLVPEEVDKVICLLHPSFFDFLTSPMRCTNSSFRVDIKLRHGNLAHACLVALKDLRRDMCHINSTTRLNSELIGLQSRIAQFLPLHLQYACRHWVRVLVYWLIFAGMGYSSGSRSAAC